MYTCKYIYIYVIIYGPVLVHIYTYHTCTMHAYILYIYADIRVSYIYLQYTCISLYHIYYTYVSKSIVQEIPGKELPDSAGFKTLPTLRKWSMAWAGVNQSS